VPPLTGRLAFQKLYAAARNWAPDAWPVRLESKATPQTAEGGQAYLWAATFASFGKAQMRSYSWSAVTGKDAPEPGVTPGNIDIFTPGNVSTRPFDAAFLKIDTDQALAVAEKNGGARTRKQKPETRVLYALQWDESKGRLLWRVIYGDSPYHYHLIIDVNASTGEYVRKED
jgi:hypothetical protein